jgi:hypothetical protein
LELKGLVVVVVVVVAYERLIGMSLESELLFLENKGM